MNLGLTLRSVLAQQSWQPVEDILEDGRSSDGMIDLIKNREVEILSGEATLENTGSI